MVVRERGLKVRVLKNSVDKLMHMPAEPESPYPHVISWAFSLVIMFTLIYVCEVIGL